MSRVDVYRAGAPARRPGRVIDLKELAARKRRRRAWALLVSSPVVVWLVPYLIAGGSPLAIWPLVAVAGVAVVLGVVSAIARWSARQEARDAERVR
jgi:hypothetical protein